jgi:hypothetical protein
MTSGIADGTNWRDAGEKHAHFARTNGTRDPLIRAVLAVYCEMRHEVDGRREQMEAMNRLSIMLDQHSTERGMRRDG